MKNSLIAFTLLAVSIYPVKAQLTPNDTAYIIYGHLAGLDKPMIVLEFQTHDHSSTDTAIVHEGSFEFAGIIREPQFGVLWYDKEKSGIPLFVESGQMQISGKIENPSEIEVQGSVSHHEYSILTKSKYGINAQKEALNQERAEAKSSNDTHKLKAIDESYRKLNQQSADLSEKFILKNPGSFVAMHELKARSYNLPYEKFRNLFENFNEKLKQSDAGQAVAAMLEKARKTAIGQPAINFSQDDMNGNPVILSSLKGKYVLLEFWASWCGPCRLENPNLVKLYNKFRSHGFEILGVSLDDNKEVWKNTIKIDGLTWTNVNDFKGLKNEAIVLYGVTSFPTNYLIDPDGIIIGKNLRGEALQSEVERIMSKRK